MLSTGFDLEQAIDDLSKIEFLGQLDELLRDHRIENDGQPSDAGRLHTAAELIRCNLVARAMVTLFDLPREECLDAVKRHMLRHPRRDSGLMLINEYVGRTPPEKELLVQLRAPTDGAAASVEPPPPPGGPIRGKLSSSSLPKPEGPAEGNPPKTAAPAPSPLQTKESIKAAWRQLTASEGAKP